MVVVVEVKVSPEGVVETVVTGSPLPPPVIAVVTKIKRFFNYDNFH